MTFLYFFFEVIRHKKWVIPWMEDDPGLTAPQLWVNRTLLHGLDAIKCPSFSNSTHDTINKTEIANAYKISQL